MQSDRSKGIHQMETRRHKSYLGHRLFCVATDRLSRIICSRQNIWDVWHSDEPDNPLRHPPTRFRVQIRQNTLL